MARREARPRRREFFPIWYGGGSTTPAAPLDGTSPTGAWSLSRDLLTSFVGGSRYTNASGAVSQLSDQSGNARHLTQATAGNRPLVATAGPNSRACADFVSTYSLVGAAISNFIDAGQGYIIVSFLADTITAAAANIYANETVFGDQGGFIGCHLKDTGLLDTAFAYNFDTDADGASAANVTSGVAYVVEWKHVGGNVSLRINGGSWLDIASGNTSNVTGALTLGKTVPGPAFDGKIFEMAAWSTVPASADAIAADFKAWVGASSAPVIVSSLAASGAVGTAFSYQITATNSPTSYNATGLPSGLSINTSTGAITGTPTAAATTNVTIIATNASGSDSKTLVLTVSAAGTLSGESAVFSDIFVWLRVTTDTASGTLYAVVCPAAASAPSGAQIEAGQDGSGAAATASANQAISAGGAKALQLRGLTAATAYKVYGTHKVGSNYGNIVSVSFTTDVLLFSAATTGAATGLTASTGCAALSGGNLNIADPYGGTGAIRFIDTNDSVSAGCQISAATANWFNGVNKVFVSMKHNGGAQFQRISPTNVTVTAATNWNCLTGVIGTNGWMATPVSFDVATGWKMLFASVDMTGQPDIVGGMLIQKGNSDNGTTVTRNGTNSTDIYGWRITRAGP